jgi:hypothetical protein
VISGKKYVNIYVGNAIMYEAKSYSPPLPAIVQVEWAAPVDEENGNLIEEQDVKVDPTPPVAEGEEEEEE